MFILNDILKPLQNAFSSTKLGADRGTSELTKMVIFGFMESQVEFPFIRRILVDFP